MPYASSGTLTTDTREIAIDETWGTQSDWTAYQSASNVDITNGIVSLAESTIPSSTIHRWPFSAGSGTTATDSVGTADASINGPTWTSGTWVDGYALSGDGVDDYMLAPSASLAYQPTDAHTILYTLQTTGSNVALGVNSSGSNQYFTGVGGDWIGDVQNGAITIRVAADAGNGGGASIQTDSTFNDGNKHRVAIHSAPDYTNMNIYVDGTAVSTSAVRSGTSSTFQWPADLGFFASNNVGSRVGFFDADLDDVMICNQHLTSQEIQDDYNRQPWV